VACAITGDGDQPRSRSEPLPPRAKTPSPRKKTANPKASPSPSKPRAPAAPLAAKPPVAGPPAEGEPKIETTISASARARRFPRHPPPQLCANLLPDRAIDADRRLARRKALGCSSVISCAPWDSLQSADALSRKHRPSVGARKRAEVRPDREQPVRQASTYRVTPTQPVTSTFTRSPWMRRAASSSSIPNIPASPPSIPSTASSRYGGRTSSRSSRRRTAAISTGSRCWTGGPNT
jgi:hypothetical protein